MFSWMIWIAMGILVGWTSSVAMPVHSQQRTLLNVLWGVVGAAVGGGLFASGNQDFALAPVIASFLGAVVLVASIEFLREVTT